MKRKGFFLIFALWLFVLLSFFCLGLGFKTFIEIKKTKLFLSKTRAFYLAVSGVKLAKTILEEDEPSADYPSEDWALLDEEVTKIIFSSPKGEGQLKVTIQDESSRINMNMKIDEQKRKIFLSLFEEIGIENSEGKLNYIVDYIDEDNIRSGSDFSEENVKDAHLAVIEELLLINDISTEEYSKIKKEVTVIGDGKININTADEELIAIIVEELFKNDADAIKEEIFKKRYGQDGMAKSEDDEYYAREAEFPQSEEGNLSSIFKVNSEYFRIISEAEVEGVVKKITCIVKRDGKIIYWYEK